MISVDVYLEEGASVPQQQSPEAAGADLCCLKGFTLYPGKVTIVDTGLIVRPPFGYCSLILPRSGLAAKHAISVLNSPGLIDRDYCGPKDKIKVIMLNHGEDEVHFKDGDRIAQVVFVAVPSVTFYKQSDPNFAKADSRGGLGSTGVSGTVPTAKQLDILDFIKE